MEHVFWIVRDRLAGRCGPLVEPWDLRRLARGGFGAILCLAGEIAMPRGAEQNGMSYLCVPLGWSIPPGPDDRAACLVGLPRAYDFVKEELAKGHKVLVHCHAGKDRTGLFMAYYLAMTEGLSAAKAIARVRSVREKALSASGWEQMALDVIEALRQEVGSDG